MKTPHFARCFFLAATMIIAAGIEAQVVQEIEPNHPCSAAQQLAAPIALPTIIDGSLDSNPAILDVDFFRVQAPPGAGIQLNLEGASSSAGTLNDPLLGLFDSGCAQIAVNDDGGIGLNSRLLIIVPDDGVFIVAATAYPDFEFLGGGFGTYALTLSRSTLIDSIGGRFVDIDSGAPLPGTSFPFTFAQLLRCDAGQCFDFVNFQTVDDLGNFLFDTAYDGSPLLAGTYQVIAAAIGYEPFTSEPFDVLEGDALDLGDIGLTPLRVIGTVSGRLVDGIDASPLSGGAPPFAGVVLERCDSEFCYGVASAIADGEGRFWLSGAIFGLSPGAYRLRGFADNYEPAVSAQFDLEQSQDLDVGDFALLPFPIQVLGFSGCEVPPGGGTCAYTVDVLYRGRGNFRGEAWSSVEVYGPPNFQVTRFQVGKAGTSNPMPQQLKIRNGELRTLAFQFGVPDSVATGTSLCAFVTIGREPAPQFNNRGTQFLFCAAVEPTGFRLLPQKTAREHLRRLQK